MRSEKLNLSRLRYRILKGMSFRNGCLRFVLVCIKILKRYHVLTRFVFNGINLWELNGFIITLQEISKLLINQPINIRRTLLRAQSETHVLWILNLWNITATLCLWNTKMYHQNLTVKTINWTLRNMLVSRLRFPNDVTVT